MSELRIDKFWCQECGQSLTVCDGEGVCTEARKRSIIKPVRYSIAYMTSDGIIKTYPLEMETVKFQTSWTETKTIETKGVNQMAQYKVFKVGDLVKVDLSKRSNAEWWDAVRENKVYKVSGTTDKIPGTISYFLEGLPFVFNVNWLMPAFKFEIGEKVKVDDAIGHIQEQYKSNCENCYLVHFENDRYTSIFLSLMMPYSICYRESQIEKYEPEPVKEETKPEVKKRKPLEVFAMLNEYFDYYWDVEGMSLVVGIREGTTGDENTGEYKRKEFCLDETKQAYKWLVKQALKLDAFENWYNGQD